MKTVINIKGERMNEENVKELKARKRLLLKQAREDYRFLRKEIKLFLSLVEKITRLVPAGWTYRYNCGSARSLNFTKTGLDYRGKKEGRDFIGNPCADELNLIHRICERHFKGYFTVMPVYVKDDKAPLAIKFHSMTGELEKNIEQKNGRMKKLRIHFYYYQ